MKAACMNAELAGPWPYKVFRCNWQGEISDLDQPCPRCGNKGRLAPVVEVPEVGGVE